MQENDVFILVSLSVCLSVCLPVSEHAPTEGTHAGKRRIHPGECVCMCVYMCVSVCLSVCQFETIHHLRILMQKNNDLFILVSLSFCLSENIHQLRVLMQENDVLIPVEFVCVSVCLS